MLTSDAATKAGNQSFPAPGNTTPSDVCHCLPGALRGGPHPALSVEYPDDLIADLRNALS